MLAAPAADLAAAARTAGTDITWEPKFDGFRCLVWRDGAALSLQSRTGKPLERYFPELVGPLRSLLPQRCILDGELLVRNNGRGDFDALSARIHPAASRIEHLAEATPASFVAFDVLALGDRSLLQHPWSERRATLEQCLGAPRPPLELCPSSPAQSDATRWLQEAGQGDLDGIVAKALDGIVAKALDGIYEPGGRGWQKVKQKLSVDCVVGGFRIHRDGRGVASLLLGLFDDEGVLHHVGATGSLRAERRHELLAELQPLVLAPDAPHPWRGDPSGRAPGGSSRWSPPGGTPWLALHPDRVAEVTVDGILAGRFRHVATLLRWRDDRDAASCTYAQLNP